MRADQDLIPKGLKAESLSIRQGRVVICATPTAPWPACPGCGNPSRRVHSRYFRKIADLPWHGAPVALRAEARRFFCDEVHCERKISDAKQAIATPPFSSPSTTPPSRSRNGYSADWEVIDH